MAIDHIYKCSCSYTDMRRLLKSNTVPTANITAITVSQQLATLYTATASITLVAVATDTACNTNDHI